MSENSPSFSVDAHLVGEPSRRIRTPSQTRSGVSVTSPPSLFVFLWSKISPILWKIFIIYVKIFIFVASLGIFVLTTVVLYSLIYWMVIPKRLHSYPAYFDYSGPYVCSTIVFSAERQWETANRPIHDWDKPTGGYDFDVMLTLDFPANHHNKQLGPVMFETKVFSAQHTEIVSTKRPFFIPHISWLAHLFRDTVYMALAGLYLVTDKLSAEILLIESLPVYANEPLSQVTVCMHSPGIHVYSGQVHFVSKLSGIRYLIAHHPIFVGLVVVGIVLAMALAGILAAAIFRYVKSNDDSECVEGDLSPVSRPSSGNDEFIPGRRSSSSNSNLRKRA